MKILFEVIDVEQAPRVERFELTDGPWTIGMVDVVLARMYDALQDDDANVTFEYGRGLRIVLKGRQRTARSGWLRVLPPVVDEMTRLVLQGTRLEAMGR